MAASKQKEPVAPENGQAIADITITFTPDELLAVKQALMRAVNLTAHGKVLTGLAETKIDAHLPRQDG